MQTSNELNRVFGLYQTVSSRWLFEAEFDEFRAAADTVRGRLISRNAWMQRFEPARLGTASPMGTL
jgi:hypothetical protein